jgi:hypothetical protein
VKALVHAQSERPRSHEHSLTHVSTPGPRQVRNDFDFYLFGPHLPNVQLIHLRGRSWCMNSLICTHRGRLKLLTNQVLYAYCMYVCRLLHIGRIRMDIDNPGLPGT